MTETLTIAPQTIDCLMQRGAASAIALETPRETLEFAAIEDRVAAMASVLRGHGLVPGDRVATWLAKTSEACLMPLAAARAGLVHVPVNPLLKRAQVAHILADSGARLLLSNAARLATLDPGDGDAARVDVDGFANAVAATKDRIAQSPAAPDDIAAILYTSGSTGKPKGVVLSHANLWLGAQSVAHYLKLSADDRTLCVLPLSFDYGQNQLFSTWYAGGACIPLDYLTPRDVMKSVARRAITTLAGVPPLWVQLVELDWADDAGQSLRRLTNSGGALTRPLVRRLRALFPDADLYPMYGLTEAFRSTYLDPALVAAHPEFDGARDSLCRNPRRAARRFPDRGRRTGRARPLRPARRAGILARSGAHGSAVQARAGAFGLWRLCGLVGRQRPARCRRPALFRRPRRRDDQVGGQPHQPERDRGRGGRVRRRRRSGRARRQGRPAWRGDRPDRPRAWR